MLLSGFINQRITWNVYDALELWSLNFMANNVRISLSFLLFDIIAVTNVLHYFR